MLSPKKASAGLWSYLEDLKDNFLEDVQLGQDAILRWLGYTLALSLNFLLITTKFGLIRFQLFVGLALLSCSVLNAYFFFRTRKLYHLFHCTNPGASPNITKLESSPKHTTSPELPKDTYHLYVWCPSELSTCIFSFFSPVQVAIVLAADPEDTPNIIFHVCVGFLAMITIAVLVNLYTGLQRDRSVISNQAYEEYNRFVLTRLAVPKADAAVQVGGSADLGVPASPPSKQQFYPTIEFSTPTLEGITPLTELHRRKTRKSNPFQKKRLEGNI